MSLVTLPRQFLVDSSGTPRVGAKLHFYAAGTSTPITVWTTAAYAVEHSNPVLSVSSGLFPAVYVDPSVNATYKMVITDSADVAIYTDDNIPALGFTQGDVGGLLFPQTVAEDAAEVTPTNYGRDSERGYDVRRAGVTLDGTTDDTADFQDALDACNGRLYIPKGTIKITSAVTIPAGTEIWCDVGATINASGVDYSAIRALGSLTVTGLTMTRTDTAQNTSYKAIHADNSIASLPANTRIVVRDCVMTGFDIGVYVDGGGSQNVDLLEVSSSRIVINTLGTGGGSSVRPTVTGNNCKQVVIDKSLLDSSDATNAVNNVYCIGSSSVYVTRNTLQNGISVKVLSNSVNAVHNCVVAKNRIVNTSYLYFQADTQPIKDIAIFGNSFISPNTSAGTPEVILWESTGTIVGDAFEYVLVANNYFRDCPYSIYLPNMTSGDTFGTLVCESNHYRNTSTASAGSTGIISNGGAGTYRAFAASNEVVIGNSNTRAYIQAALSFSSQSLGNIIESGCTNARSGINQGSFTATLTGVDAVVTGTVKWTERDGIIVMEIPDSLNGTSNTTAATLTGVPAAIRPTTAQICVGQTVDNTTSKLSFIKVLTDGTIQLFNGTSVTFTGSGTKGVGSTITYRLQ